MALTSDEIQSVLVDLVAKVKRAGADYVEAAADTAKALQIEILEQKLERAIHDETLQIGLRVVVGRRQAIASTSQFHPKALSELLDRAVTMARHVPEDPYIAKIEETEAAATSTVLDIFDPSEPTVAEVTNRLFEAEQIGLDCDGITASGGGLAGWCKTGWSLATSDGYRQRGQRSAFWMSVALKNEQDRSNVVSGNEGSIAVYGRDLLSTEHIGRIAAKYTNEQAGARKVKTAQVPVIFDARRPSRGLLAAFMQAISGTHIARGSGFLKSCLGTKLFPDDIQIIDDPTVVRGLRSRNVDCEGVASSKRIIVKDGILQTWMLDRRSAHQLGMQSTGHGIREAAGLAMPVPSNVALLPGKISLEEMIGGVKQGLYVTKLMGPAVNYVTGDYSRGAKGIWIENGQLAYPVHEITIGGNLKQMFSRIVAANDIDYRHATAAPSLMVDQMTVGGM